MSPSLTKLGDIADVNWGNTSITKASYTETGYPAFSATGCDGFLPDFEHETAGVILSAIGAKCGKCFSASGKWTAIKNTITITPHKTEKADFRFLFYYLNREEIWPKRGVGQPFIGLGDARKILVPFPPLAEQRRIAEVLDRAEALRAKRRAALAQLDSLIQSLFLDLHRRSAPMSRSMPLAQVAETSRGSFVNGPFGSDLLTRELQEEGVPVIYIRDIRDGEYLRVSKSCVSERKARDLEVCSVCPGDVLVAKVGDPPGIAAVYPTNQPKGVVTQDVIRIRVSRETALTEFIVAYLNSSVGMWKIAGITIEATRARFSLRDFKAMKIEIPPMDLQREFAGRVGALEKLKAAQRASLAELDALFASLQHRAFRGEL